MTEPDFNSASVRADTVMGKLYTEAEVQALVAAKMEEAHQAVQTWQYETFDGDPVTVGEIVMDLITPDMAAALEARDKRIKREAMERAAKHARDVMQEAHSMADPHGIQIAQRVEAAIRAEIGG